MKYILVQDDCSHWYVIPKNKEEEWEKFINDPKQCELGCVPEFADQVGGSPTLVEFENYNIK